MAAAHPQVLTQSSRVTLFLRIDAVTVYPVNPSCQGEPVVVSRRTWRLEKGASEQYVGS